MPLALQEKMPITGSQTAGFNGGLAGGFSAGFYRRPNRWVCYVKPPVLATNYLSKGSLFNRLFLAILFWVMAPSIPSFVYIDVPPANPWGKASDPLVAKNKVHGHTQIDCFKLHPDLKKPSVQASGKHGSAENNKIYVPIVDNNKEENVIQVEPPPASQIAHVGIENDIVENVEEIGNEPDGVQNTSVFDLNSKKDFMPDVNNVEITTDPKLFILIDDMPISNAMAIENALISRQDNNEMVVNGADSSNESYEEVEFIPPSNLDATSLMKQGTSSSSPIKNVKDGQKISEEDVVTKGGKKKGIQNKNTYPATSRSTRAQTSSKDSND
ncbi:hypothetical protein MA16_Dca003828 [Dendrobium catenatum]|uniref:Uncharacterized protein n=1 Tax=Dendrobium catenatum TaxID=906689 RepID=A0A2I0X1M6_9ASPA|nr:hypothetical protein MA16_Dca003828 [Dendrobium catenatum]